MGGWKLQDGLYYRKNRLFKQDGIYFCKYCCDFFVYIPTYISFLLFTNNKLHTADIYIVTILFFVVVNASDEVVLYLLCCRFPQVSNLKIFLFQVWSASFCPWSILNGDEKRWLLEPWNNVYHKPEGRKSKVILCAQKNKQWLITPVSELVWNG